VKALEKNFYLRDFILMFPMHRIPQADPRVVSIKWFNMIKNCWKEANALNIDIMDYPHLVGNVRIHLNVDRIYPSEFPPIPEEDDQNFGDKES
jgi:hypothetical protein